MDNQHKLIKGYRDLSQVEIDLINEGKALAEQVGSYTEKVKTFAAPNHVSGIDLRWLNIGITDLQKGFMAVIRSIAKPETF